MGKWYHGIPAAILWPVVALLYMIGAIIVYKEDKDINKLINKP